MKNNARIFRAIAKKIASKMAFKEPVGLKIAKAQGIALGKIRKEMQPEGLQEGIMAQSLANILIHIIFSTKNRQPMILPEIIKEL